MNIELFGINLPSENCINLLELPQKPGKAGGRIRITPTRGADGAKIPLSRPSCEAEVDAKTLRICLADTAGAARVRLLPPLQARGRCQHHIRTAPNAVQV